MPEVSVCVQYRWGYAVVTEIVPLPGIWDFEAACRISRQLEHLPKADCIELDFSSLKWVEPFPMLYVAAAIRRTVRQNRGIRFRARGAAANSYAAYMGLFRSIGLARGPALGVVGDHETHLPIDHLDLASLRTEADERSTAVGALVEQRSKNIARTLLQQNHGKLWQTIQYAIREIMRNAAEHSLSSELYYCGQFWPEKGLAEVAILDEGCGIFSALSKNPHLKIESNLDALRLAVLPGVSGTHFEGSTENDAGEWGNSGFGLYVVSELCGEAGSLTIISGETGYRVSRHGRSEVKASHAGTALRLVIDTTEVRSIAASLALIVARGERFAKEWMKIPDAKASPVSKRIIR